MIEMVVEELLPGARVVSAVYPRLVLDCRNTPKEVFDAQAELRRRTHGKWEIMMTDMPDKNPIRVKLALKRGA